MGNSSAKIPENWEVVKFSDVAELQHGYQFRNYDFTPKGIKVFKITQIKGNSTIDISSCNYIEEKRLEKFQKFCINKGDILMALTGATIGKIARYNSDEIILQNYRVGNFHPLDSEKLNKDYLYHILRSDFFFNQILARQTQSAQQNIGKDEINQMHLYLPPIEEQRIIASILSALDDKIELNLQMNKTLEEMAMALYKHWFVDFGPFQDGGFVDSELGEIPKGWEVKSIHSIANFINGAAFKPKDLVENKQGGLPVIKIAEIKQGITAQTKYSNKTLDEKYTISNGDILFPWSGNPHTSLGIHLWDKGKALLNQHIFVVRIDDLNQKYFVYNLLKNQLPVFINLATHKQTTGLGHITVANLKELLIPFPKPDIIEIYNQEALPFFEMIYNTQLEVRSLKMLRDTLLPKLISGEVRVKDAKKNLSEVL